VEDKYLSTHQMSQHNLSQRILSNISEPLAPFVSLGWSFLTFRLFIFINPPVLNDTLLKVLQLVEVKSMTEINKTYCKRTLCIC
jgi:hypothetical protein